MLLMRAGQREVGFRVASRGELPPGRPTSLESICDGHSLVDARGMSPSGLPIRRLEPKIGDQVLTEERGVEQAVGDSVQAHRTGHPLVLAGEVIADRAARP